MKRALILLLLSASAIGMIGCNTMHGLGKDVEKLGEKVQQKSAQ